MGIRGIPSLATSITVDTSDPSEAVLYIQSVKKAGVIMNAGRLILLVDDEQLIRNMLRSALEKRGYEVVVAGDGVEALGLFMKHQSKIAAVITDITMPAIGGVELARRLAEERPGIPILFMSGICDELPNDLRTYGCIQKPFSAPPIPEEIERMIAPPQSHQRAAPI
jgi:CheY-like chemotaxis protein